MLGEGATYAHLDVADEEQWVATVAMVAEQFGRVDVLVNNAGIVSIVPLLQTSLDLYRKIVDVNQVGVFLGMREVLPRMISAGAGSIVNVSSVDGLVGSPGLSAYSSAKHAVVGLTKSAALEVATLGVRVNSVHPGVVDTPMLDGEDLKPLNLQALLPPKVPMKRMAQAEEIAGLVAWLASDESSYCTGSAFVVDGGILAGFIPD
jgi:3alpha(or 20beta)-hydroxysteroid dehydrogenase